MQQILIPIDDLLTNDGQIEGLPANPRYIRDEQFVSLVNSLKEDPDMLELRELIVFPYGDAYVVIGGNMRLQAAIQLHFKHMPCKVLPVDTPIDKLKRLTIKDNGSWGQHDWDMLASEWDDLPLNEWGVAVADDYLKEQPQWTKQKDEEEDPHPSKAVKVCPHCGETIS